MSCLISAWLGQQYSKLTKYEGVRLTSKLVYHDNLRVVVLTQALEARSFCSRVFDRAAACISISGITTWRKSISYRFWNQRFGSHVRRFDRWVDTYLKVWHLLIRTIFFLWVQNEFSYLLSAQIIYRYKSFLVTLWVQ